MKKHLFSLIGAFALALGITLVPAGGAHALTISPPTFDYSLNPGDTVLDVVKIYNEGVTDQTLYPLIRNFTFKEDDEEGTPEMYPASEVRTGTELAPWITADQKPIFVKAGERVNLPFAINVPEDAQPGGHYGSILFSNQPPIEGGTVGLTGQVGPLILVRIAGEVKEDGKVTEFGFVKKQLWYNYRPIDMFVRFENGGNTHLRPTGNVFIKNWMGRQVAAIKVNDEFRSVLPQSIRRFSFGWKGAVAGGEKGGFMEELEKEVRNFGFGKYKAELVLSYGTGQKMVADVREFTIWPWRLMIVVGLGLIVLLGGFIWYKKNYDKAIIRRYEKRMKK